jgi:NADPH:quinone reductase-like Zn-dependent oxidoreductase
MAGIIEEVGPDVTAFKCGDEVFGMVGGVGGLQGTLAEFIAADVDLLAPKPSKLSMRQAAALPLVAITAWEGLVESGQGCACLWRESLRHCFGTEEDLSSIFARWTDSV